MRTKWALIAAGAAICGAVAAPAGFAAADDSAEATISALQAKGYTVNIDRVGSGPMSKCVVTNVRNPVTNTQLLPYLGPGRGRGSQDNLIPTVVSQSISVSLDCSKT
jgi:V8-like Glu-specific endopeptidase